MAYGKRNSVSLNPLDYSLIFLGESGIGKTTLIYEACKTLAGDDGYLFMSCGSEYGCSAIEGINYINCTTWNEEYDELNNDVGFYRACKDIIENKTTDYPNLKVVVWDTLDALQPVAEKEEIRRYNQFCVQKGKEKIRSINEAEGGYGKGQDATIEMLKELEAELLKVNVRVWKIAHVKLRNVTDVITGETYQQLTSNMQSNYFNAFKNDSHFMALGYIDRELVKERKKNSKDSVNKVVNETRKIKFRDDDYCLDSKSRFKTVVEECEFDADSFINVLKETIEVESKKSGKPLGDIKKEQAKIEKKRAERIVEVENAAKADKELQETINNIMNFINENRSNLDTLKPIMKEVKGMGYENPKSIDKLEDAKKILEMCK